MVIILNLCKLKEQQGKEGSGGLEPYLNGERAVQSVSSSDIFFPVVERVQFGMSRPILKSKLSSAWERQHSIKNFLCTREGLSSVYNIL